MCYNKAQYGYQPQDLEARKPVDPIHKVCPYLIATSAFHIYLPTPIIDKLDHEFRDCIQPGHQYAEEREDNCGPGSIVGAPAAARCNQNSRSNAQPKQSSRYLANICSTPYVLPNEMTPLATMSPLGSMNR